MRVVVDISGTDCYAKLIAHINAVAKGAKKPLYNRKDVAKVVDNKNISVSAKKKKLLDALQHAMVYLFAQSHKKNATQMQTLLKKEVALVRVIVERLLSLNRFIGHAYAVHQGSKSKAADSHSGRFKEHKLKQNDIDQLEHTVFKLMNDIVSFDNKLIKKYSKAKTKVEGSSKTALHHLYAILAKQTALLMAVAAKLPPSSKITKKLAAKKSIMMWAAFNFAIITHLQHEHSKEVAIVKGLKKSSVLKNHLSDKIKKIQTEKERVLRLQEERALSMKKQIVFKDLKVAFNEYTAAAGL